MPEVHVFAERAIAAPAEKVYHCLADYKEHHSKFLPPAFSEYKVEEGGVGEGTIVSFRVTAGGRERSYRMKVTEPEKGRVLMESDLNTSLVTTFTVTPAGDGCSIRIDTRWNGANGIKGFMERLFAPPALRGLYNDELNRLVEYVRTAFVTTI
ncbi:MAG: SRPBCC family protein [Armatimonadota bacterium]|nr:SRPBCC family protein [Armatimonadota bacterium]